MLIIKYGYILTNSVHKINVVSNSVQSYFPYSHAGKRK